MRGNETSRRANAGSLVKRLRRKSTSKRPHPIRHSPARLARQRRVRGGGWRHVGDIATEALALLAIHALEVRG